MNKKTKLLLTLTGVAAIGYYVYNKSKKTTTVSYAGNVGDRLGFASDGYVQKGNLYNRNMRYGMTGQKTFFENQPEKLNY